MSKVFTQEENKLWAKKLPGKMCSACLVIRSSQRVLMVKASYKDHWTFPSGIVDPDESPKSAALRETNEEVGLNINQDACTLLTVIYAAGSQGDRERFNFAFITDVDSTDIKLSVPNEEIESAEWVDFNDIAEKSGNKGSYKEFQKILLNPGLFNPYIEI
ncbi:hypothetical protein A3F64_01620 [Candidatus Saccharibacteria bacterium RIFCSPHIGHO2_12_FULL_42_8]|nr:MAG: hypothetical protein A3F64_01620 [Candidatus Saccharibacteria bacterium RIFCSPHIGHO2_12_FULL_42_8]